MVHDHWVLEYGTKKEHRFSGAESDCFICHPSKFRPCHSCKALGAEYGRQDCRACTKEARRKKLWTIIT